jgi:OmpA-OmpF porin, OOP family
MKDYSMKTTTSLARGLLALATVLAPLAAQAQSNDRNYNNKPTMMGWNNSYIGLSAGKSDFSLGNGIGIFGSEQGDTAYRLHGGSYFNANVGLEMAYTDFGKVNRAGGTTKADGISLSVVGKLPLSESFNLIGRIGSTYGRTRVSSDPTSGVATGETYDFGLSYGVGAEFQFNPRWSAVLDYDSHNLKFAGDQYDRIGVTTLGARYRF